MKENDGVYWRNTGYYCVVRDGLVVANKRDHEGLLRHIRGNVHINQYPLDKLVLPMEFFE